jgi:hypothetical protein
MGGTWLGAIFVRRDGSGAVSRRDGITFKVSSNILMPSITTHLSKNKPNKQIALGKIKWLHF